MRYHVVVGGGRIGSAVALSHLVRLYDSSVTHRLADALNCAIPTALKTRGTTDTEEVLWIDLDPEFGSSLQRKKHSRQLPVDCYTHPLSALLPPSGHNPNRPPLTCTTPSGAKELLLAATMGGSAPIASISICTPLDGLAGTFTGKRFHLHQPQGTSGGGLFYKDTHEDAAKAPKGASESIVDLCTMADRGVPMYVFTRGVSEDGQSPVSALQGALGDSRAEDVRVVCGAVVPEAWAEESCHLLAYLRKYAEELVPSLATNRPVAPPHSKNADLVDMDNQHADLEREYWFAAVDRGTVLPPTSPTTFTILSSPTSTTPQRSHFVREATQDAHPLSLEASSFINGLALVLPSICGSMSVVGWGTSNSHHLPFSYPTPDPSSAASLAARLAFEQTTVHAVGLLLEYMTTGGDSSPSLSTSGVQLTAALVGLSVSDSTSSDYIAGRRYASFGTLGAMLPSSYSVDCPHLHAQEATYSGLLATLEAILTTTPPPAVIVAANTLTNILTLQRGIECRLTTKARCALRSDHSVERSSTDGGDGKDDRPYSYWLREEEMSFRKSDFFSAVKTLDEAIVSGQGFNDAAQKVATRYGSPPEIAPSFK